MGFLGALFGGGGPSKAMENDASQQSNLSNLLLSGYQQRFGEQSQDFQNLRNSIMPIISQGPDQHGFSNPVLAALHTTALNNVSAASRNARQVVANGVAGQNNTSGLTSGVTRQIQGSVASNAANELANTNNQISLADWTQGTKNYWGAVGAQSALAGMENPSAYAGLANESLGQSFKNDSNINTLNQAKRNSLIAGFTSLGIDALTAGMGGFANTSADSTFGENVGNFFSGAKDSLSNQ